MCTLRVQIVIDRLGFGGAETLLADLAEGAPSAGLELRVVSLSPFGATPAAERLRARGIEPVHVPLRRLLDPRDLRALRSDIAAYKPDVVHTHLAYADVMGGLAARSLRVPAYSTLHVMAWEGGRGEQAKHALAARVRRHCMRRVIAVSEAGRAAYLSRGWDKPDRVVVVPNGIARRPEPGAGAAVRASLGIGADERVVTMLTVLRAGKGHEEALAALPRIREAVDGVRLVIAGDGPDRERIESLARDAGDAVAFAGHRDDVMALLDATDVLLHPTHVDALPTSLIEALAAGTPIVATRVGGVPEITDEVLVPAPPRPDAVAEAVVRVLNDRGLGHRLSTEGRARFEAGFTAEAWASTLRKVYSAT